MYLRADLSYVILYTKHLFNHSIFLRVLLFLNISGSQCFYSQKKQNRQEVLEVSPAKEEKGYGKRFDEKTLSVG